MVANPAHGQLNREYGIVLSSFAPDFFVCETGLAVPSRISPPILYTQAEYFPRYRYTFNMYCYYTPIIYIGLRRSYNKKGLLCVQIFL